MDRKPNDGLDRLTGFTIGQGLFQLAHLIKLAHLIEGKSTLHVKINKFRDKRLCIVAFAFDDAFDTTPRQKEGRIDWHFRHGINTCKPSASATRSRGGQRLCVTCGC